MSRGAILVIERSVIGDAVPEEVIIRNQDRGLI